jgi:hypothetical protein
MSLDVGIVTIEYMDSPAQPAEEFLFDLLLNPYTGVDDDENDDDEFWGGSWSGNGLYEFGRAGLISRARNWSDYRSISPSERADLLVWIEDLPWQDDRVMLHLGM